MIQFNQAALENWEDELQQEEYEKKRNKTLFNADFRLYKESVIDMAKYSKIKIPREMKDDLKQHKALCKNFWASVTKDWTWGLLYQDIRKQLIRLI